MAFGLKRRSTPARAWRAGQTRRGPRARAVVATLAVALVALVYLGLWPPSEWSLNSALQPRRETPSKPLLRGSSNLLEMEDVGGVDLVSIVGTLEPNGEGEKSSTGVLRLLVKALLLRDGRTILRGAFYFDLSRDDGELSNPPALAALPLELRVYDASEFGSDRAGARKMCDRIPPRRVASYGLTCAYGERAERRGVKECRSPDDPTKPRGEKVNFMEFRVDLGRLGQDLANPEERPQVGVWLSVQGWAKGVDLSRLVASPEIADVGAVHDDEGERVEVLETVRGRVAASSLARGVAGTQADPWPFAFDRTMFGRSGGITAALTDPAANASTYELPRDTPFYFTAEDYARARATGDSAFVAAYEAATRPSVDLAAFVPPRYAPGREPPKRAVQVWTYLYQPKQWYVALIPRLVEHFLLNGGSAVMLYVSTEFGRKLLETPTVADMVDAGVLALVHWRPFSEELGSHFIAHNVIGAHATLAHWGRSAVVLKTDMDELLSLPPRPWANQTTFRNAQMNALQVRRRSEVERLGTLAFKDEEPRSEELWTTRVRGKAVERQKLRELATTRPGRDPRSFLGVGGLLAGGSGGFYSAETNMYAVYKAADAAARRAALAAQTEVGGDATGARNGTRPAGERFELFAPEEQLAPLTARQRRLARIFGANGCLHRSVADALVERDGATPGLAQAMRSPRCGIFHCLPALYRAADPRDPKQSDGARIAAAPSMAAAMRIPMASPLEFAWRKPAYDPDAVPGSNVHWSAECLGGRTQAWGRAPPGGVGAPLPIRKRADGYWNLEEVGLPQSLATNDTLPPRIESACRITRACTYFSHACVNVKHLVNLNVVRGDRKDPGAVGANDWLWVYHEADPTRPFSSVQ